MRVRPPPLSRALAHGPPDKMEFSTSKEVTVAPTFEDMHLKENLLRGIYAYGYESPSAVQSRAIVQICKGRDTIAQAQSGTGKTATFSISILQILETAVRETQGKRSTNLSAPMANFPSACSFSDSRTCNPNPERHHGSRRLHECAVSCLHRRYERWRGYQKARLWPTCSIGYSGQSCRYDQTKKPTDTAH